MTVMRMFVWLLGVVPAGCAGGRGVVVVVGGSFGGLEVTLGPVGVGWAGCSVR